MKKLLILVAIATLFASNSFGQFQMGLKMGLNSSKLKFAYSTISNDDVNTSMKDAHKDNVQSKMGLNFAFVMNTGGNVFQFQPEIAFAQRGAKIVSDGDLIGTYKYNYIDIKPLFNIGGGAENWKIYAHFGPSINFWLSKKSYDADGEYIKESDEWSNDSEEENGQTDIRLDIGFVFGAGFKYKLGPGWILANPRYEFGLLPTTIYDLGSEGFAEVNRTFSFNLGYLYEF
ncbi:MAG: PorT family protein [Bacteroidales bacterium]|nr:PorT family protein [Bacteroidales bacterium]